MTGVHAEIVAAPLEIWLAPVNTAFPEVDTAPAGPWAKLGTSGDKNYTEAGVSVTHSQTINTFRPAGSTAARKAWRTAEELLIDFELVDLSSAQYAKVLNNATVSQEAAGIGDPGQDDFNLLQGVDVALFALLARGLSTYDASLAAQYQVPIVYQAASPKPVFMKGNPAGLAIQFAALEDDTLGFGKLVIETHVAS